ncbi:helix-turn-helix transcriptional regulator [Kribbella sandramycini]|uniref:Helix-turn-helix transcriptional regulator n=1 Tax=Kribbella sandramycini TaxID=60450 RepID=A0A7Y4L7A8_9ACTN|nr:helix-turn-helix transcriptional regulator [Kribbella sandramycini]MBB6566914.1 transcriptional regulator with XRE-family HTH domain [Kribbella sandramycini]NOL44636.1 helix-turn-helix transcriptional regulator [Kribbella sandramycini]
MDRDSLAVSEALGRAVAVSGLSQAAFATALGTSASRFSTYRSGKTKPTAQFFLRAGRIASALQAAREYRILTAPATAAAIREATDVEWAWRVLLQGRDHLRLLLARHDGAEAAWEAAPATTGQTAFDTLLATLTAREFAAAGEDPPTWTEVEPLAEPWIPDHPFLSRDEIIAQTPDYLARLNIFVPARDLVTA